MVELFNFAVTYIFFIIIPVIAEPPQLYKLYNYLSSKILLKIQRQIGNWGHALPRLEINLTLRKQTLPIYWDLQLPAL
jgi:hypothetical protein